MRLKLNSTTILIIFLFVLLIIIVIVQINRSTISKTVPNNSPSPSAFETEPFPTINNQITTIQSTNISNTPVSITSGIIINFKDPLDPSNVVIEIEPTINFDTALDQSGTQLTISPLYSWGYNTQYNIRMYNKNSSGNLDKEYSLDFKTYPYTPEYDL